MSKHEGSGLFHKDINIWRVKSYEERPNHPEGDLYHLERNIWGEVIPATVSENQLDEENEGNYSWHYYRDGKNRGGHGW